MTRNAFLPSIACALMSVGCKEEPAAPPSSGGTSQAPSKPEASKPPVATPQPAGGHSGEVIPLGEQALDGMSVRASRDKGEIKAAGDAPIDVWIDGGVGNAVAVRFWIGTEDAKGSIKAKADIEDGKWHTHAEVPVPLPAEGKLWVEIEDKEGKKTVASFDLKI